MGLCWWSSCYNRYNSLRVLTRQAVMDFGKVLATYTLEEILELNDVTEEEILEYLVCVGVLELPKPLPVDV